MLRILAHENMEEWSHVATVEQETVAIAVKAFAEIKIVIPPPSRDTPKSKIRYAPSFIQGNGPGAPSERPYTAVTLAKFLGMKEWKVDAAPPATSNHRNKRTTHVFYEA